MQILWKGQTCFSLIIQRNKQEQIKIVIDPFGQDIGLRLPSLEADIALITHEEASNTRVLKGDPFVIAGPGEYEIKDVFIKGIACSRGAQDEGNTLYMIKQEGMSIGHLGKCNQGELTSEQVEEMGDVDIVLLPVGGKDTMGAKEAARIVSQVEPRIIIPMQYALPKLKEKLAPVTEFLKTMGIKAAESQNKLVVKAKDLTGEEARVVVLHP